MTSQMRKMFSKFVLGILLLSFVATACNNKKDKKEAPPAADTIKVDPLPTIDTTQMDKDTADTRPIKPVDPVKPGD